MLMATSGENNIPVGDSRKRFLGWAGEAVWRTVTPTTLPNSKGVDMSLHHTGKIGEDNISVGRAEDRTVYHGGRGAPGSHAHTSAEALMIQFQTESRFRWSKSTL